MGVFWSPLSFETSFKRFRCPTKKCQQFFFFLSWLSRQQHTIFFFWSGLSVNRYHATWWTQTVVKEPCSSALLLCLAQPMKTITKTTDGAQCNYTLGSTVLDELFTMATHLPKRINVKIKMASTFSFINIKLIKFSEN